MQKLWGKLFMNNKGFTLIELMIVIAIIGILAAVAILAYQNYTIRAQITEAIQLASKLKTNVVGNVYANLGTFTGIDSGTYGLPAATSIQGNYVSSVGVTDGVISATLGNNASNRVTGDKIVFTPTDGGGSITWKCTFTGPAVFVPSACR